MEKLTITLNIENENKKFESPDFIPGSFFRKAAEIASDVETGSLEMGNLDDHFAFVCEVFENKFTITEFENGVDARMLIDSIYAVTNYVLGNTEAALKLMEGKQKTSEKEVGLNG